MRFFLIIIIGLFPLVFISCKPQGTPENIIESRAAKGAKPSQPAVPATPPPPYQPPVSQVPPPVNLPPSDSGEQPPPSPINSVGTLEGPEDPSWNLCSNGTPNDTQLYDQTWIDSNFRQDRETENHSMLYQGVSKLIVPDTQSGSGGFLAYGENSFAAITVPGKKQAAFAAGATINLGKIFVFGHSKWITNNSYYSPTSFQGAPPNWNNQITYLKNVLIWLLGDSYKSLIGTAGTPKNFLTNISNFNIHSDYKLSGTYVVNFPDPIDQFTYPLVVVGNSNLNDKDVKSLTDYLRIGGRVLIGVWPNYGANTEYVDKILRPAGISYYATYSQSTDFNPPSAVDLKNSQFNLHSLYSLAALEKNNGDLTLINKRKDEISLLPKDDPAFSCKIVKDFQNVSLPFPMKKNDSLFKYSLLLFRNYYMKAPPDQEDGVPVPDDVDVFPGIVPIGTPLVERSLSFNLKFSTRANYRENLVPINWQATGLYAPPGQIIRVEVTLADATALKDFRIVINTHTDDLTWISGTTNLTRHPILPTYHSLKPGINRIRNPFGGLIVLEGTKESDQDKIIDLTISDAVEAAWLKEDTTDTELTTMKTLPAPWAMIQGPRSVAVVPISTFRQISSAKPLRDAWSYIHVLEDNLAGKISTGNPFPEFGTAIDWIIPHKWPDGRTWHVIDKQIESGQAHAGNPVMYSNSPYDYGLNMFIKPTKLLSDSWTLWHEMGHNHQQTAWTTGLDQEVTTNILSAYMQDNGYKYIDPPISPPPFRAEVQLGFKIAVNRLKGGYADIYKTSGPICSNPNNCPAGSEPNNNDPYRRLIFFMQLIRYTEKNPAPGGKKGYDIISELYSRVRRYDYQTVYKDLRYDDQKKTDNLFVELSDITKIDLTVFFDKWGRTVSPSSKTLVQGSGYLQPPSDKPIWKCDPYNPDVDNPC